MNIDIYIDGNKLDLQEVNFTINLAISELEDFTKTKSFKTSTIRVPATHTNAAIFKNLEDVEVRDFDEKINGYIDTGSFTFYGYVKIFESETIGSETYYNFQIIASSWVDALDGVTIDMLDFTTDDHTITAAAITTSETVASTRNYIYPLVDHGAFIDRGNIKAVERFPATAVNVIFEKILNYVGYKLHTDSFFNVAANQKYYLYNTEKIYLNDSDFAENRASSVICSNVFEHTIPDLFDNTIKMFTGNTLPYGIIPFDTENATHEVLTTNYNKTTYRYTVDTTGAYRFQVELDLDISYQIGINNVNPVVTVFIKKNGYGGTTLASEEYDFGTLSTPEGGSHSFSIDTSFIHLVAADYVEVWMLVDDAVDNTFGDVRTYTCDVTSGSEFICTADPRRGIGYALAYSDILPSTPCIEFLKAVRHIFNLWFYTNVNEREILVCQADDFHSTTAVDWSDKLDESKAVKVYKYESPKEITYSYLDDDKDYIASTKTEFSSSTQTFENNQANSIEVRNGYFSRTIFGSVYTIGIQSEHTIPKLLTEYIGSQRPEQSHDFKPRIWYYEDNETLATDTWVFEGNTKTNLPHFTETNLQPSDILSNYAGLHKNFQYSKVVEAYFNLSNNDVANFVNMVSGHDFRTPVRLETNYATGVFYVIEINKFNPLEDGSTLVKLLQVNDKNIK